MFYRFQNFHPVCDSTSYVHSQATVIGNVIIGKHCYIGPGAVLRGDWGEVVIEDGCNVQEGCCIHMFPGVSVRLEQNAHVGHGAVVHGAHLGQNCMIGMNAVIMDEVHIGAGSLIGALAFLKRGFKVPERSIVVGNPAKIVGSMDDKRLAWKTKGTELYQTLPGIWQNEVTEVDPLEAVEPDRPGMKTTYQLFDKN